MRRMKPLMRPFRRNQLELKNFPVPDPSPAPASCPTEHARTKPWRGAKWVGPHRANLTPSQTPVASSPSSSKSERCPASLSSLPAYHKSYILPATKHSESKNGVKRDEQYWGPLSPKTTEMSTSVSNFSLYIQVKSSPNPPPHPGSTCKISVKIAHLIQSHFYA